MIRHALLPRSGAELLADQLLVHGVEIAFGVPGESYLALLDALAERSERVRFIVCRHEGGAAFMAESYAKLTGRPGVCLVTRGPGACNAAIGVHTAHQDSSPLVLLVGQVGTDLLEREAFQEIDYRRMFGPMAKWVAQIDRVERVPEFISRAFQTATSGRPGPVVLALPEDMLAASAAVPDALPYQPVVPRPAPEAIEATLNALAAAERPFVLVGGFGWSREAARALREVAEALELPVGCAFRFQDIFDNAHPNYAGDVGLGVNPALAARIREADWVLVLGARLGEATTSGYTLFAVPRPRQRLIHVHPDPEELGRVYQAERYICSGVSPFALALARALAARPRRVRSEGREQRRAWMRELAAWRAEPPIYRDRAEPARLNLWQVMQTIERVAPADAILTNGAGNFATWAHRFFRYRGIEHCGKSQLAPSSGAMGYGLPAALMAALVAPERLTIHLAGDGDFLMTAQELATAQHYGAAFVSLVFNNGMYGTIRMHQERAHPGRVYGTALTNPDFAAFAQSFGVWGARATSTAQFEAAFVEALSVVRRERRCALIELVVDPEDLTPGQSLSAIRAQALAERGEAA
ncbi:MAG: thiamine pyrophosphate-binding protein [Casimicrobiaceae bacterium]|nr:thiamine pyrophosphate-binding protein [Casimicrobiaceae bacterium]MDW8311949.1 thiamine pyrophosphate-binding protein [Burkholderiales bacterium]